MDQKPKVQYIQEFYVYGSEAKKLKPREKREPRTRLPLERLEKLDKICLDPVALVGIAVAVFMLVAMVIGMIQLYNDWTECVSLNSYVSRLNCRNEELTVKFRESLDLGEIENKALGQGMIPKAEAKTAIVYVTMPEQTPQPTFWEEIRLFWAGLFA